MIDFKDWKKTKEDKHGVEMEHSKGHSMYIMFKGVPMVQREALKRLPLYDGGSIKGVHKSAYDSKDKELMGESEAGKQTRQSDIKPKSKEKAKDEHHRVLGEMRTMPNPKIKGLAKGGVARTSLEQNIHDQGLKGGPDTYEEVDNTDYPVNYTDEEQQAEQIAKPKVVQADNSQAISPAAEQASVPVEPIQPTVSAAAPSPNLPNGSMSAPGAAQLAQQANAEQAQTDIAKSHAMVPVEEAKLMAQREQAQRDQDNINMLKKHADVMAATLKNIDPNHLTSQLSAPKKVMTALGLALGAFSEPFGGHNYTADFLNKQIDRDIEAQKTNNENQKTIYGAYHRLYGDQRIAADMAKASMADIYASQGAVVAQKLGTPQAIANYHKLQSDLSITKNKAILDAGGNLRDLPNNPNPSTGGAAMPSPLPSDQKPGGQGGQGNVQNIDWKILKPGASAAFASQIRYNPSIPDADKQKMIQQMTNAEQSEKALGDLHQKFASIANEAVHGGWGGYFHRKVGPHTLGAAGAAIGTGIGTALGSPVSGAGIGTAIGEGAGHVANAITGTSEPVRQYDADKAAITGYLSSALKGTNIGGQQIAEIVNDNLPEYRDTPASLDKKRENLREFILNHLETDALKRHGFSYR
jgi:hypothetical protein